MQDSERQKGGLLLFLPVETKAREMDAKVLLACVAAERGHRVIIGEMRELTRFVEYLPRGIYISKSIPDKTEKLFRRLKSLGYGVSAWCEEGLVFRSRDDYKREKVSVKALRQLDLFFAWGKEQARAIIEKAPEADGKLREVGNPRTDLIRTPYSQIYNAEAERFRGRYGDFILFNTNFSIANNILGTQAAFLDFKKRGKVATQQDEERYWQFHDHKLRLFEEMRQLVESVSRSYPHRQIVVRPHPSENHEAWRTFARSLENVEVIFEGSAVPWIMAADVLIHNGCTTAVEAYYLNTPAIAFRPVVKHGFELELPNSVSEEAVSAVDVCTLIESLSANDHRYADRRASKEARLKEYMADTETGWASDRIVEALEDYYNANPIESEFWTNRWVRWAKGRFADALRELRHNVRRGRRGELSSADKHRQQKLPELTLGEIEDLIDRLAEASGRFENVQAKPVLRTDRCFVIQGVVNDR